MYIYEHMYRCPNMRIAYTSMKNNCHKVLLGFINNLFSSGIIVPLELLTLHFHLVLIFIFCYSAASLFTDWFLICISQFYEFHLLLSDQESLIKKNPHDLQLLKMHSIKSRECQSCNIKMPSPIAVSVDLDGPFPIASYTNPDNDDRQCSPWHRCCITKFLLHNIYCKLYLRGLNAYLGGGFLYEKKAL